MTESTVTGPPMRNSEVERVAAPPLPDNLVTPSQKKRRGKKLPLRKDRTSVKEVLLCESSEDSIQSMPIVVRKKKRHSAD